MLQPQLTHAKSGFTLAEVLITLGIIGIVAAMTMPVILENTKKQTTVAHLKKFYTTMNQALRRSEADNGEYKHWETAYDLGAENYFNKYWKPYIQILKICDTYSECGYSKSNPFIYPNGRIYDIAVVSPSARTTFILADGTTIINFAWTGGSDIISASSSIFVDINGYKPPNVAGHDLFLFERKENGMINPKCMGKDDDYIKQRCTRSNTDCCTIKILQDGWQIKDDYPW